MKTPAVVIPPTPPIAARATPPERRATFATTGAALAAANPRDAEFITQKTLRALSGSIPIPPNFSRPLPQ